MAVVEEEVVEVVEEEVFPLLDRQESMLGYSHLPEYVLLQLQLDHLDLEGVLVDSFELILLWQD